MVNIEPNVTQIRQTFPQKGSTLVQNVFKVAFVLVKIGPKMIPICITIFFFTRNNKNKFLTYPAFETLCLSSLPLLFFFSFCFLFFSSSSVLLFYLLFFNPSSSLRLLLLFLSAYYSLLILLLFFFSYSFLPILFFPSCSSFLFSYYFSSLLHLFFSSHSSVVLLHFFSSPLLYLSLLCHSSV